MLPPDRNASCSTAASLPTGQLHVCPCLALSRGDASAPLQLALPDLIRLPVSVSSSRVHAHQTVALLDHGATINIMSQQLFQQLGLSETQLQRETQFTVQVADDRQVLLNP